MAAWNSSLSLMLVATFAVGASSCAFKKDAGKKDEEKPTVIIQTQEPQSDSELLSLKDVKIFTVPLLEFNRYIIAFKWPQGTKTKLFFKGSFGERTIDAFQNSSFSEWECIPTTDPEISVSTYAIGSATPAETTTFKIHCPQDKEIVGTVGLEKSDVSIEWPRVFIRDNAILDLDGKSVDLKIGTLVMDRTATIRTYASSITRKYDGGEVPTVQIRVGEIVSSSLNSASHLRFELKGLNGREGRAAEILEKGNPVILAKRNADRTGRPGNNGKTESREKRVGGRRDEGGTLTTFYCAIQPSDGGPGLPGEDGTNGENGHDGMDVPSLNLQIGKSDSLDLNIVVQPGKGGAGGIGSKEIPGGVGGTPGSVIGPEPHNCTPAKQGPKGIDGKPGLQGASGQNGKLDRSKIIVSPNVEYRFQETPPQDF